MKHPLLLTLTATCLFTVATIPVSAAEPAVVAAPTDAEATADARFLEAAAWSGLGEIEYSNLAEGRTKRDEVKNFATAMVKDHKEMAKQLSTVADRVKVKIPSALLQEQKDIYAKLKDANDADFDRMYMDTMVLDHRKAVAAFESAAKNSKNAEVRTFAAANLPHLQGHLQTAEVLAKKLGSIAVQ